MMRCVSFALVGLGLILSGCADKKRGAMPGGGGMPPVQVIVAEARIESVSELLSLVGSLQPDEMIEVRSETEGVIQEINFQEGQEVGKGDLLIRLDDSKFTAALAEAEANFKLSEANFSRARQLLGDNLVSQQDFEQLAATFEANRAAIELKRRQLKDTRIHAAFSGVVGARHVSPGQVINRDTRLTWLVDLDPVKVEVNVPERYLQELQIGRSLEFSVAAFPGETFRGDVYFVSPHIDESLRTALVKARIPNPDRKLRGGMFASLELTLQVRDAAILIPETALMSSGDHFSVFVVDDQATANIRPIQVGLRLAGKAEITKGLKPGDNVVVEGIQKLRPGAPVKLAPVEASTPAGS